MNKKLGTVLLSLLGVVIMAAVLVICAVVLAPQPVYESVTMEAGSGEVPLEQFPKEGKEVSLITDISNIDLTRPAEHILEFLYKEKTYQSVLKITDTTPPEATPVEHTVYNDETLTPEDFVTDIRDVTQTTVTFDGTPDFTKLGEQTVTLRLTDSSQNTALVKAKLTVIADTTAPVFSQMDGLKVNIGQTVSYRKNITVTDDRDGELTFTVDASAVNLEEAGTYQILYEATDSSGNTAKAERTITVSASLVINEELVDQLVQETLETILTEGMTDHEKITAIYNYTRRHIAYSSSSEKDILSAAYKAITKGRGDCFNYFALAKVLLDKCGIANLPVERYKGSSSHYWLLVNIGTGWYHYDTSPQSAADPFRCFMKTNEQVKTYGRNRSDGRWDYYRIDESKYPELATEKYKAPEE